MLFRIITVSRVLNTSFVTVTVDKCQLNFRLVLICVSPTAAFILFFPLRCARLFGVVLYLILRFNSSRDTHSSILLIHNLQSINSRPPFPDDNNAHRVSSSFSLPLSFISRPPLSFSFFFCCCCFSSLVLSFSWIACGLRFHR